MIELEPFSTGSVEVKGGKIAIFTKGLYVWQDGKVIGIIEFKKADTVLSDDWRLKAAKQNGP